MHATHLFDLHFKRGEFLQSPSALHSTQTFVPSRSQIVVEPVQSLSAVQLATQTLVTRLQTGVAVFNLQSSLT